MVKYTKFSKLSRGTIYKKLKLAEFCEKPIKTKIKINLYVHKNPGKLSTRFQNHPGTPTALTDFFFYTI